MKTSTHRFGHWFFLSAVGVLGLTVLLSHAAQAAAPQRWTVNTPIVSYWCGPAMTDATATQMAEGGWNVVWCTEKELDVVQRHGLRAQLSDGLLTPAALDDPKQREKLEALVARVRQHPALYSYFITDEPNAKQFPELGRLVAFLRERDPAHMAFINLFPTYASNEQLGNKGDLAGAYQEHLRQYVEQVKPGLISYDHYQFSVGGDNGQYFLNLALIRQAALDAGLPFLNIVQSCTWTPSMRVPVGEEMRYLVYTTLAYGAQGISYYIYTCPGHTGGIANADGTPTAIYPVLKVLNHEFVNIATQLQPLRSIGIYHAGMMPPGANPIPKDSTFVLDPPVTPANYAAPERVKGVLLSVFGPAGKTNAKPTCALVVNLDYKSETTVGLRGAAALEVFDATTGKWSSSKGRRVELKLQGGDGKMVRVQR